MWPRCRRGGVGDVSAAADDRAVVAGRVEPGDQLSDFAHGALVRGHLMEDARQWASAEKNEGG